MRHKQREIKNENFIRFVNSRNGVFVRTESSKVSSLHPQSGDCRSFTNEMLVSTETHVNTKTLILCVRHLPTLELLASVSLTLDVERVGTYASLLR